jgi:MFS family permease
MALPMSTAILAASFAPQARGQALGLFASAIAVGRMTGPAVGGFLVQIGGWHWIFWMNFVLGAAVTLAVLAIFRGPGERFFEAFDTWGAVALLIGYPALLIGFTFGASLGWFSAPVIAAFILAALGLSGFVWIELRTAKPLIDVALFREPSLAGALAIVVLSHLINQPIALAAPLYLQIGLGAPGVVSGFVLAILPLATALVSPWGGRLADRVDAWTVSGIGVALLVFGIACYAALGSAAHLAAVGAVLAAIGAGLGLMTPANQKVAFASVRQADYGVLAAMLSSFGTAAGTIGITITVALMDGVGGAALWHDPATFASAQGFAFACMVPLGLVAVGIAFKCRHARAKFSA